jgi:hypothetical protein
MWLFGYLLLIKRIKNLFLLPALQTLQLSFKYYVGTRCIRAPEGIKKSLTEYSVDLR